MIVEATTRCSGQFGLLQRWKSKDGAAHRPLAPHIAPQSQTRRHALRRPIAPPRGSHGQLSLINDSVRLLSITRLEAITQSSDLGVHLNLFLPQTNSSSPGQTSFILNKINFLPFICLFLYKVKDNPINRPK